MSQKLGWTLGGALTGWLLALWGFEANTLQTEEVKQGIRLMLSFIPAAGALLSAAFIVFYKLSDQYMQQITNELIQRREEHTVSE
jgi:GPH family glycoside/pentoside/hexuronide:cation symporter